jgi:hypothetical protein
MGFINRTSWRPQPVPLLSLPRNEWDEHQLVPWIPHPSASAHNGSESSSSPWVDLIINNLDDGSHPFHLHGHSFYVLATHKSDFGWGSYFPSSDAGSAVIPDFNLENPLRKDTVMVPRRGFAVLRFQARNMGVWMLHCHVLVHQASGMAMGIQVGGEETHAVVDEGASRLCGV